MHRCHWGSTGETGDCAGVHVPFVPRLVAAGELAGATGELAGVDVPFVSRLVIARKLAGKDVLAALRLL